MERMGRLSITMAGPDSEQIVHDLLAADLIPEGAPWSVRIDHERVESTTDWLTSTITTSKLIEGTFENGESLSFERGGLVALQIRDCRIIDPDVLLMLGRLPFEVISIGTVYSEWFKEELGWDPPSFSDGHVRLGWACGFKGSGHDRLVSRRWLDHGPWRTLRQDGDVTWVIFHDLAASPEAAIKQAEPGHARMGYSDEGGYIPPNFVYKADIKGVYDPDTKTLRIPIAREPVTQRKMLEMSAAKIDPRVHDEQAIDQEHSCSYVNPTHARSYTRSGFMASNAGRS